MTTPGDLRARTPGRRILRWILYPLLALVTVLVLVGAGVVIWVQATMFRGGDGPGRPLALTGATVLTGPELEPRRGWTVVVDRGGITALGPEADVSLPPHADVRELSGHTVLPGLIDSHVHLATPSGGGLAIATAVVDWFRFSGPRREAMLDHGVTTMRSLGDDPGWITDLRGRINSGELSGPRVFAAGPVFTTPGGHPVATIGLGETDNSVRLPDSPGRAREMVRELLRDDDPVDAIKVIQERGDAGEMALDPIPPEVLEALIDEAHAADSHVVAHWGTPEDLTEALDASVDELQHMEPRGVEDGWDEALLGRIVDEQIPLAPTMSVVEPLAEAGSMAVLQERLREFTAAGGVAVAASDAPMNGIGFGDALVRELELFVDAGLPPREALVAATATPGSLMPVPELGVLDEGNPADLLVVRGDPLADITAVRDVALVVRDGAPASDGA